MPKITITTQGCSANLRESELMAGLLERGGQDVSHARGRVSSSEAHIINICTVKKDNTPLHEIKRIRKEDPNAKIIVAGCITDSIIPKIKAIDGSISLVNTHNFGKINSVVEQSLLGNQLELLDKKYELKVDLPSVRKNQVIGIVPILNGCNYFCTFCSTKLVKGKLFSYPMDAIRNDVKAHVQAGCKEIWITSNDTGAYMVDQGGKQRIVELLDMILSIPQNFKLRVGMMNPGNTLPTLDKLIEAYKSPKMFKFLHIPLQAGSNEVLKAMNRKYTIEQFLHIIQRFRKEIPGITISTDIIVGFPTETKEQFQETLDIMKKARFDVVNISQYSPREGTIVARMKGITNRYVKERSREVKRTNESIIMEINQKWVGWEGKILIDEQGKDGTFVGRNFAYKPIILKGNLRLGSIVNVAIEKATTYDLHAKVIR